jgi:hypothetical protein
MKPLFRPLLDHHDRGISQVDKKFIRKQKGKLVIRLEEVVQTVESTFHAECVWTVWVDSHRFGL